MPLKARRLTLCAKQELVGSAAEFSAECANAAL